MNMNWKSFACGFACGVSFVLVGVTLLIVAAVHFL